MTNGGSNNGVSVSMCRDSVVVHNSPHQFEGEEMKTGLEHLTEDELINHAFSRNNLTPLELELTKRLDRASTWAAKTQDPRQLELDFGV